MVNCFVLLQEMQTIKCTHFLGKWWRMRTKTHRFGSVIFCSGIWKLVKEMAGSSYLTSRRVFLLL